MEKHNYIKKWLEGTLSEGERRVFEQSEEFKSLQKLSGSLRAFKAPEYQVEEELNRLHAAQVNRHTMGKVISIHRFKPFLKVAAALLILLTGYILFLQNTPTNVKTLASEKTELMLPDSSFVALNANSHLAYTKKSWEHNRKVTLEGEAFFKVDKGTTFDVETSAGTVSVLGTQFNVKARKGFFEVVCYEGLVQVHTDQAIVKLYPTQRFRVVDGKLNGLEKTSNASPAWLQGESAFESVPFKYVIEEFERQYDVSIVAKNIDLEQRFTGSFPHSDKTLALKSIALPLNLTFRFKDDQQIILLNAEQ